MSEVLESNNLDGLPTLANQAGMLDIYGGLKTPYSADVIVLSDEHQKALEEFVLSCIAAYGPSGQQPEPTHVQSEHGVPTLIARVDCTIDENDGSIKPYELEDSPSGIGITDAIHRSSGGDGIVTHVREHYQDYIGGLPFMIVTGKRKHGTDDALVLGEENYHYQLDHLAIPGRLPADQLVIVKAIPGDHDSVTPYLVLQDRSVCTMLSEGDKT